MKQKLLYLTLCLFSTFNLMAKDDLVVHVKGIDQTVVSTLLPNDRIGSDRDGMKHMKIRGRLVSADKSKSYEVATNYSVDMSHEDWNKNWNAKLVFEADKMIGLAEAYTLNVYVVTSNDNTIKAAVGAAAIKNEMEVTMNQYGFEKVKGFVDPVNKIWVNTPKESLEYLKSTMAIDSVYVIAVEEDGSFTPVCYGYYKLSTGATSFYANGRKIDEKYFTERHNFVAYLKTTNGKYLWGKCYNKTLKRFFSSTVKLTKYSDAILTETISDGAKPKLKPLKLTTSLPCKGSGVVEVINKCKICVTSAAEDGMNKRKGVVKENFVTKVGENLYPIKAGTIKYNYSNQSLIEGVLYQDVRVKLKVGSVVLKENGKVAFNAQTVVGVQLKENTEILVKDQLYPVLAGNDDKFDIEFNKTSGLPVFFRLGKAFNMPDSEVILPKGCGVRLKVGKVKNVDLTEATEITFNGQTFTVAPSTPGLSSFSIEKGRIVSFKSQKEAHFTVDGAEMKSERGSIKWTYDESGNVSVASFIAGDEYTVQVYKGNKAKTKTVSKGQRVYINEGKITKIK